MRSALSWLLQVAPGGPSTGQQACLGMMPLLSFDKAMKRDRLSVFRQFTSPGGFHILAGRNNRQNDELTHSVAKPADVWMHARGVPGQPAAPRDNLPPLRGYQALCLHIKTPLICALLGSFRTQVGSVAQHEILCHLPVNVDRFDSSLIAHDMCRRATCC